MANRELQVLEVADGKMFDSPNAVDQQNKLRGLKTDNFGKVIENSSR